MREDIEGEGRGFSGGWRGFWGGLGIFVVKKLIMSPEPPNHQFTQGNRKFKNTGEKNSMIFDYL